MPINERALPVVAELNPTVGPKGTRDRLDKDGVSRFEEKQKAFSVEIGVDSEADRSTFRTWSVGHDHGCCGSQTLELTVSRGFLPSGLLVDGDREVESRQGSVFQPPVAGVPGGGFRGSPVGRDGDLISVVRHGAGPVVPNFGVSRFVVPHDLLAG